MNERVGPAGIASERGRSSPDDASILSAVGRGDVRVFDVLVDRHKDALFAYLRYRIGGDAHEAEDLLQEVFLRVFRSARRGEFAGRSAVKTWLFAVANNCITDHLRARRRRSRVESAPGPSREWCGAGEGRIVAETPLDAAIEAESRQRVVWLLAQLPEPQREVVAMKVMGGLTFAEIAEATGCPVPTIKSRMRYGLSKIQRILTRKKEAGHA